MAFEEENIDLISKYVGKPVISQAGLEPIADISQPGLVETELDSQLIDFLGGQKPGAEQLEIIDGVICIRTDSGGPGSGFPSLVGGKVIQLIPAHRTIVVGPYPGTECIPDFPDELEIGASKTHRGALYAIENGVYAL